VVLLVKLGICHLPDTAGAITACEDGWVAFQGSCYLFGRTAVHFTEAEVRLVWQTYDTHYKLVTEAMFAGRIRKSVAQRWL